jgi:hypothetical protein
VFRRRHGEFGLRVIGRALAIFAVASALMALVAIGIIMTPGLYTGGITQKAAALIGAIGAGIAVYLGAALVLGAREPGELRAAMRARQRGEGRLE